MIRKMLKIPARLDDIFGSIGVPYMFSAINVVRGNCTYEEAYDLVEANKLTPTLKEVCEVCFNDKQVVDGTIRSIYAEILQPIRDEDTSNAITLKRIQLARCINSALRSKDMFLFVPSTLCNLYIKNSISINALIDMLLMLTYTKDQLLHSILDWDTHSMTLNKLPVMFSGMLQEIISNIFKQGIFTHAGYGLARMGGAIRVNKYGKLYFETPRGKYNETRLRDVWLLFTLYIETYYIPITKDAVKLVTTDSTVLDTRSKNQLRYVFGVGGLQSVINQYRVDSLKSIDDLVDDIYSCRIKTK